MKARPAWSVAVHAMGERGHSWAPLAAAVVLDPIRTGQFYELPSGRLVTVTGLNGANIACVYAGENPDLVGLRRDFVVKYGRLLLNPAGTDRGAGS